MKKSQFIIVCLFLNCTITISSISAQWKSLPIRSESEYLNDSVGGEGEQYILGFSRCLTHPEYLYAGQDVCGSWRSTDGGISWKKNIDKGLYLQYSQSIEVDPVNPNKIFIAVDQSSIWPGKVKNYQGIYQSMDGGNSWIQVLNSVQGNVRKMRHIIAYSLPSRTTPDSSPTRWYSADSTGIWLSNQGGDKDTWEKIATIPATATIIDIVTHPTSIDTIYVCTENGLYRSTNGGENLAEIPQFSTKKVTSVLLNASLPNKVYVTIAGDGMYLSTDNGSTFTKQTLMSGVKNISSNVYRAVMNPGFPEQIYLIGAESTKTTWISNDGGITYNLLPNSITFPGLGRDSGWRRWLDGVFCGICPNPLDKSEAVGTSRATFQKVLNYGTIVKESATGFTGNAAMQTDRSIAFHPYNPNIIGIFCFDVGPRISKTGGDWFYSTDPIISSWRSAGVIKWGGSYSAAYQPVQNSEVVVASIGMYISNNQIMRSTDNGLTWGSSPITPNSSDKLEAFHFIAFDPEITNIVYAGDQISTDTGLTFSKIAFPSNYTVGSVIPITCGVSQDPITKKSYVFALDANRKIILRSDDHGLNWKKFFDLNTVSGSARFIDSNPTFAAHPTNPDIVYALDVNHDLLKITYDPASSQISTKSLNVFAAIPNWVPAEIKTFNQVRRIGIDPTNPDIIYASMLASGIPSIYRSMDGGENWVSISDSLNYQGGCVVVNPHTGEVYKGSMTGTYVYPAPSYSEIQNSYLQNKYHFQVNYNHNDNSLTVSSTRNCDYFKLLDITGKEVKQFNTTAISTANLAKGVYIIKSSYGECEKTFIY